MSRTSQAVPIVQELLTRGEVCHLIRLSKATLERYHRKGRFPKPVKLGPNRVAWLRCEIEQWLQTRIAERDSKPGGSDARVA